MALASIGTFEIERTVPMNLYSLSKGRCCLISIIALLLGITVVIVGFLGPPIFVTKVAVSNSSAKTMEGDQFAYTHTLYSPAFGRFNRQLLFKAIVTLEDAHNAAMSVPLNISLLLRPLIATGNNTNPSTVEQQILTERMLSCSSDGTCNAFDLIRFVMLPDAPFALDVKMLTKTPFKTIAFNFVTFNPDFTNFELWLRVSMVFFAFVFVCWFMHSMRKWSTDEWNLEQIWQSICLCGLIFYNDPIFGILLLKPTATADNIHFPVADIVSFSLRSFYVAVLGLFWLSTLHGIRESSRGCCRFYAIKFAIILPLWFLSIAAYAWAMITYTKHPEIDPAKVVESISPILIAIPVILGLYVFTLLYSFLRSCIEVCRLSYLNVRLSYAACLCFGLITLWLGMVAATFAVPDWRVKLLDPVLCFYSSPFIGLGLPVLVNAHAFLSAILYGPAVSKSMAGRKDSKPLVMASDDNDDSDEEIVYEDLKGKHRQHKYSPVATSVDRPVKSLNYQK